MSAFVWLDRGLIYGPYYTLCLTLKDFKAAMKYLGVEDPPPFIKGEHSNATTHFCTNKQAKLCAVVTMADWHKHTGIVIAGLLVHEAVHIWQEWCSSIGETNPGSETEAYSVQWLSQQLMWEFQRQVKPK